MFSIENFYYILHQHLLKPLGLHDVIYKTFGCIDVSDLAFGLYHPTPAWYGKPQIVQPVCYFVDQEPMIEKTINQCMVSHTSKDFKVLANSEHSELKQRILKETQYQDWYYFFHGFAALDWYRDAQFLKSSMTWQHPFMCMNSLYANNRSYRLNLVARLIDTDLVSQGAVSLNLDNTNYGTWQDEVNNPHSLLSKGAKKIIYKSLSGQSGSLRIDNIDNSPQAGQLSANFGDQEFKLWQNSLWHVVTETVFYEHKHHLTEKIFKPIVSKRPFILVGAPGNLAYLKSYGFLTFDQWIDESYDNIQDPDQRIQAVVGQLQKICKMPRNELEQMHLEMQGVLDHNFQHMWNGFKNQIVSELVDNFELAVRLWNNGRVDGRSLPLHLIDFCEVKRVLLGC